MRALKPDLYSVPQGPSSIPQLHGGRCRCGYVFFPMQTYGCEKCGAAGVALTPSALDARGALVGLTPQGWLRTLDVNGRIHATEWPERIFALSQAGADVISVEDVSGREDRIEDMASNCRILSVNQAT